MSEEKPKRTPASTEEPDVPAPKPDATPASSAPTDPDAYGGEGDKSPAQRREREDHEQSLKYP